MNKKVQVLIGKELCNLRNDYDYSIQKLSEKSTLHKDTLYRYENGKGNSFVVLGKILNVYGINYKIFFDRIYSKMQKNKEQED